MSMEHVVVLQLLLDLTKQKTKIQPLHSFCLIEISRILLLKELYKNVQG